MIGSQRGVHDVCVIDNSGSGFHGAKTKCGVQILLFLFCLLQRRCSNNRWTRGGGGLSIRRPELWELHVVFHWLDIPVVVVVALFSGFRGKDSL